MSHVDEGILHALLDGALAAADSAEAERVELHLAACADCRARLEDAARLRDEAGALLASAQPRVVAVPPFEEIRARARSLGASGPDGAARVPQRRRRAAFLATPFSGLAWAATVVLAVGLGWMLHDTVDRPERVRTFEMAEEAISAASDAAPESEPADVPAGSRGQAELPPTGATAGAGVGADGGGAALALRPAERPVAEEGAPQGFQSRTPPAPVPAAQVSPEAARAYDVAEAAEDDADRNAAGDAVAAAPPPAAPPPVASQVSPQADGWQATSAEQAGRLVGELVRIDGAELVAVASRTTAAGAEVRSVQMTERGEMLTLVQRTVDTDRRLQASRDAARRTETRQREAPAAGAEAAAVESMQPSVAVQIGDRVVTISGAVERERLEEIADGLR